MQNRLPGREQSPDELALLNEEKKTKQRHAQNKKIRCPCCKKNKYFDQYFSNEALGVLTCPNCGVLFIDQDKLKIIKKNISEAKSNRLLKRG